VAKLGAYRGIAQLTGMTLAAEVVHWRRFATARAHQRVESTGAADIHDRSVPRAGPPLLRCWIRKEAEAQQHRVRLNANH